MDMNLFQVAALIVVAGAVVCDLRTRRVPNVLTFGAAAAALGCHLWIGGWSGMAWSAFGWLIGIALFFPIFALGGMGAGDVKLLGAIGAWLGPAAAVWVALFSSVAGGVMAVIVALFSGYLVRALTNVWLLLMHWRVAGLRPAPELTLTTHRGPRLAYSLPVLAGLMVTLWLR